MQTTDFQLNASSQAFKILSSSLYEDKERAVLREPVANAWDAHLEAGIKTPVSITLPTKSDPTLVIADLGVGMTHSQLTGIYSTYFSSSKTTKDDLIGGFGLGSKAPFSITDEFTITSTRNGEHSVVKAFLDAGLPKLDTISHDYGTKLANGTVVSIPVHSPRRQELLRQALYSDLFSYWEVPPNITNDVPITSAKRNIIGSTEVNVSRDYSYHNINFGNLILGEFKYSVPENMIARLHAADYMFPELIQYCRLLGCDNYATLVSITPIIPIGSIELAPSRERIEDTEANYQTILEALQSAGKELLPTAITTLTTVTNKLHALTQNVHTLDHYAALVQYFKSLPESNGAIFEIALRTKDKSQFPEETITQLNELTDTKFFAKGYTNNILELSVAVDCNLDVTPTSYELTRSNTVKTKCRPSISLIDKLVNETTVYIHITDSPKANSTKAVINHCLRTNTPINGTEIPVEDHYAITYSELDALKQLFTDEHIVVLTADLVAPYKPVKGSSTKPTKKVSPTLGSIIYSSTGLETISTADFYALPSTTYVIVMPVIADNDYYGSKYQSAIKNYYLPLVKAITPTKDILVIKLPRTELNNKRFKDCTNIDLVVSKTSSRPTATAIEATTDKLTQATLKRMANINHILLGYGNYTTPSITKWIKSLFTKNEQELLSNEDIYKAIFNLVRNTYAISITEPSIPTKETKQLYLAKRTLQEIDYLEELIDFTAIAKVFRKFYKE